MCKKDFEYYDQFMGDMEYEEMLDAIVDSFGKDILEQESKPCIVNPDKVKPLIYTYKLLKSLTKGKKVKVTYELNTPFLSMGSVSVVGKDLTFTNTETFLKAAKLASNLDVYPKVDGTVQIDFTFHGLTVPLEE